MLEAGISVPDLATRLACGESTLYRLKREKDLIMRKVDNVKDYFKCSDDM
jgi:hypothetical protein